MGHINLPPRRSSAGAGGASRPWNLLDLASFSFFALVFVFFVLVFTSLGDSLAASGRRTLARNSPSDPRLRDRLLSLFDSPPHRLQEALLPACSRDEVDQMPCEDPRRNSRLSREMNFYRERHCPETGDAPLCLVPPPDGYRFPVPWPESLHKAQIGMLCGQEVGDVTSFVSSRAPSGNTSSPSLYAKGVSRNASPPWREDDKDGHYTFAVGDNLTSRYKIYSKMGEGTFGQVLECWDRQVREMVAIKVVRSIKKYREAAMIEIDVLEQLGKYDKNGIRCVQLRNWFDYRNHICIVFEKLGPSLYDFLRKNAYRSFPIDLVREMGRQLLESVAFMHDLHLIHTDLKPENILLVSSDYVKVPDSKAFSTSLRLPKSSAIKVIDFGSTTYDNKDHTYIVSTRHYRAPEVILGFGWSYPCDIWSLGCILVELCSGEALFQTHENLEHLAMMERVLGPLPQHMLKRADRHAEKYVRRGRLNWPEGANSRESIRAVTKLSRLQNLVMQHVDHSAGDLIDLLQGLLRYEPTDRLTALEALSHPFFTSKSHLRRI